MVEFEIDGKSFRFEKLTALQQFHVSRKIAPLIPPLIPVFLEVKKNQDKKDNKTDLTDELDILGPMLQPFADGLAAMSDEASEYVFSTCLSVIRYKYGDNWIQYWTTQGKSSMVADLNDISLMIRLVMRVIADNLSTFIAGFLTSAKEPETSA
jgi:hypothetical protein